MTVTVTVGAGRPSPEQLLAAVVLLVADAPARTPATSSPASERVGLLATLAARCGEEPCLVSCLEGALTMTTATKGAGEAGQLGAETRSLLRALLLGAIVELRSAPMSKGDPVLRASERALARLDHGHYGACGGCGVSIALDVLLATPHAQRCDACAMPTGESR